MEVNHENHSFSEDQQTDHERACRINTRELLIRLKLVEWGIYGFGEATAGLYLAFHYGKLGPYFGNKDTNLWPHNPLSKNATELELALNELFMDITKALS